MTTMTDALSGTVEFDYDDAGNRTSVTNPNGKTTTYTYDANGKVLTETDPLNRTHTYTYDSRGNLASHTDPRSVTASYSYDPRGNLTTVTYPGGSITFDYDIAGRRTEMVDATGTTTWSYDDVSRVTAVAAPGGTVSYSYNDAGQRATMTLPGSRTVFYAYTIGGVLESVTDWDSRAIELDFNLAGQRTAVERPNGVTTSYSYDGAGRLTGIAHADGNGPVMTLGYTVDANGNRTSVSGPGGTDSYTYDALNRVIEVVYPGSNTVEYTYDPQGNRLTQAQNSVTTHTYTYDDADQMTSDGTLSYSYDAAGNLLTAGSDSFSWTWDNRLASATVNSVTTSYAIDGLGVRVATTTGMTTTNLVWDRLAPLPLLVDDGTMAYVHAGGLLAEIDGSDDVLYHLTDALGSVRGLTDDTGTLVGTAEYEAFGSVRSSSGTASAFGFTGELTDPTTGFVHLRARDYNPTTGRFTSMDTVQPNAPGTQGYNRCAYVANNPATWTDPSGYSATRADWCSKAASAAFTIASAGLLMARHRLGTYLTLIAVGTSVVALEAAILNVFPGLRSVAGDIAESAIPFGTWLLVFLVIGVPHLSTFQFSMILLAGVLFALVAIYLEQVSAFLDWTLGLGGLCRRYVNNHSPPTSGGPQSPQTAYEARGAVPSVPTLPTAPIPDPARPLDRVAM